MALSPIFNTGFECGYPGAQQRNALNSNATGIIASGAWQEETTVVKNGSRALKSPVTTALNYYKFAAGSNSRVSARFYVRFEDLPASGNNRGVCYFGGGVGKSVWLVIRNSAGTTQFRTEGDGLSATSFGPTVAADTWYLVEVVADNSGSTEFIYVRIDGGTEHSNSAAIAAGTFGEFYFGHAFTNMNYGLGSYYDDLIFGSWDGSGDKYWGDGKGILLKPSGRAVAGSTVALVGDNPVEFGAGGTGASADDLDNLYENLDEVPMEQSGGNYVWQSAAVLAPNAPNCYLEFPIEDTTETVINSARMVAMVKDSSNSGAHNADIKAHVGGVDTSLVFGDPGTTYNARQVLIPAPGGTWDQTEVNDITARFGYASDVSPEPHLLGVLVEVDCAIVTAVNGTATPGTVGVATGLPAASASGGGTASPAAISATMTLPSPDKSAGATVSPVALDTALALPAPTAQGGAGVIPATLAAVLGLPAPTASGTGGPVSPVLRDYDNIHELTGVTNITCDSQSTTQVGDLIVFMAFTVTNSTVAVSHTLQSGFTNVLSAAHSNSSNRTRLSVAYKVATSAGAQSYIPWTTNSASFYTYWAVFTIQSGTFDPSDPLAGTPTTSTGIASSQPDPPSFSIDSDDSHVFVLGAYYNSGTTFTSSPAAPTGYTLLGITSGSLRGDLSYARKTPVDISTEDPAAFTGGASVNMVQAATFAIKAFPGAGTDGTASPAALAAALGLPSATPAGGASASPAPVSAPLALPTPSLLTGASVTPTPVATVISLPTPTVSGGTGGTVTPGPVAVPLTLPAATARGGATASPQAVAAALNLLTPVAAAGVTVTPDMVAVVLNHPTPTTSAGAVVTPATVALLIDLLTPVAGAASAASPGPVTVPISLLAPSASGTGVVVPSPTGLQIAVMDPSARGDATALAQTIEVITGIPTPSVLVEALVTPDPIGVVIGMPLPTATGASIIAALLAAFAAHRLLGNVTSSHRPSATVAQVSPAQVTATVSRSMKVFGQHTRPDQEAGAS